jgi:hypothetical protein
MFSSCHLRLFVFQLIDRAILHRDVIAWPEVDGLVDGSALPVGVEVADLDHSPHLGNGVVGRDGDVAGGSALAGVIDKLERHAAPSRVSRADDEGGGLDELELQLRSTSVGAARAVGGVDVLEDDALGSGEVEFLIGLDLGIGIDSGADPEECRVAETWKRVAVARGGEIKLRGDLSKPRPWEVEELLVNLEVALRMHLR